MGQTPLISHPTQFGDSIPLVPPPCVLLTLLDMKDIILQGLVLATKIIHSSAHLYYDTFLTVKFLACWSYCIFVHCDGQRG